MQYKTLLSALVLGVALTGEAAARGGFGGGQNQNQGAQQGQQGQQGQNAGQGQQATATSAVSSATAAAAAAASTTATSTSSGNGGNGANANALELNPDAVQTGSEANGLNASGAESGEAASATDPANFINFCAGQTLTNGLQQKQGSCNGIVMGQIPSVSNLVSTIITFPQNGQDLPVNQTFTLVANIAGIQAGSFTNADTTYYAAPQTLNAQGQIIGHTHFSVQDLGSSLNPTTAPNAAVFSFFKGIDTPADGSGDISTPVTGGLKAGNYRVCTLSSASNHQPVLMPIAQ